MISLINFSDIQAHCEISVNLNSAKKIAPYILEAQQFDLKTLLGDAFFVDLLKDFEASPSLQKYYDLWNGQEWTFADRTYRHQGLRVVLVYFTYARILAASGSEATAFGVVVKKEVNSEPVSEKVLLRRIDDARSGARAFYDDVELFMTHHYNDFQLWWNTFQPKQKRGIITGVSAKGNNEGYTHHRRPWRRWFI